MVPEARPQSYYGRPVLNAPVWSWEIPIYFFIGGMAGASAPLSLAARLRGNDRLARASAGVALAGAAASPALLVSDLGRPERFLNMLRMFKVTSPMSVGSWVLAGFGSGAALGAGRELLGVGGALGRAGQVAAAALGPPLAVYTAVLLGNTAVPTWHEARRELPFVYAGGAAASAGAAAVALTPARAGRPARRLALVGAVVELAASELMHRRLGERLGSPYREGTSGWFARMSRSLTLAGVAALGLGGRGRAGERGARRAVALGGAALLLAGAAPQRGATFKAGFASAADPTHTVAPQRERLASRDAPATRGASAPPEGASAPSTDGPVQAVRWAPE
jgi:hypothetical protein